MLDPNCNPLGSQINITVQCKSVNSMLLSLFFTLIVANIPFSPLDTCVMQGSTSGALQPHYLNLPRFYKCCVCTSHYRFSALCSCKSIMLAFTAYISILHTKVSMCLMSLLNVQMSKSQVQSLKKVTYLQKFSAKRF